MTTRTRRRALITVLLALLVGTAACGTDENKITREGSIPAGTGGEFCAPGTI
jgi:hypothetical protein